MITCPNCNTQNRDGARFCTQCAAPLGAPPTGLLPPNTMLHGRYLLLRKVAQGGMSALYQAANVNQPGTLWAVKEMSEAGLSPAERPQALADFQREANLLLNLRHPNLPLAVDLFEEAGKHFLVMAFVEGETLQERLDRASGPLPVNDVLRWAEQLCDVLAYLHAQRPPIIYRDLKPANVMIDRHSAVRLIDFGIARFHKPGQATDTTKVGTEGYASPEHYGQGQTEARSDLYTLGATLYHLLTGGVPPSAIERLLPPPAGVPLAPPTQLNSAIPSHVEAAILCALELRPDARYGQPGRPESVMVEMKAALAGKAAARPQTKPCPHCGKPNLMASLACFACGYDFQAGRAPVTPTLSPSPVPASTARLTPYTLSTGHVAATPADLPAVCDADWKRAVEHFAKGYVADWLRDGVDRLRAVHRHGPADDLEQIADRARAIVQRIRQGGAIARNAGLEEFLESLGAAPPVMRVTPKKLDFGAVGQGETVQATLTLHNKGRGYLSGTVRCRAPWLSASPERFDAPAGGSARVAVIVDSQVLQPGDVAQAGALVVDSNGGRAVLDVQGRVLSPRLEVKPAQVDMGAIDLARPGATKSAELRVRNAGAGVLTGQVTVGADWLTAKPAAFRCRTGEMQRVRLSTTRLRTGDLCQNVRLTSNAGAVKVPVLLQARFSPEPEMVHIRAGEFWIGSEKPRHRAYLSEYWIGKYPVANAQYATFVNVTGHKPPKHWKKGCPPQGKENHPVVYVNWHDAAAYCRWLTQVTGRPYRLPTEAEWEKAARGTDERKYPWGNRWDSRKCNAWKWLGKKSTTPVGAYSPAGDSPYGCADMAGNVWEWVADWYESDYYGRSPSRNPTGPPSGKSRGLRGGSWGSVPYYVRSAYRLRYRPVVTYNVVGFRCARGSK